jgi:hypothetical protein
LTPSERCWWNASSKTRATTILEFIHGLRGSLWVTFEEGTSAAWLYDLLKPHVTKVIVWDPRKNALLKAGNKNDRVDARKLSDLLRAGLHGESGYAHCGTLSAGFVCGFNIAFTWTIAADLVEGKATALSEADSDRYGGGRSLGSR